MPTADLYRSGQLKNENGIRECHELYISTLERKIVAQILSRLKGSNVLTVGEMPHFAVQGGIIQFALEDKQVRFEINLDAASRIGAEDQFKAAGAGANRQRPRA
jgi:YfiR/HmsC-like